MCARAAQTWCSLLALTKSLIIEISLEIDMINDIGKKSFRFWGFNSIGSIWKIEPISFHLP